MLSGPSELAPRASRLRTTAQNALRRDSGHFSAYLDVCRATAAHQYIVDLQSAVCAEQVRGATGARATRRLIALGSRRVPPKFQRVGGVRVWKVDERNAIATGAHSLLSSGVTKTWTLRRPLRSSRG